VVWEGEGPPDSDPGDRAAISAWNLLHNGSGAIQWQGLDLVREYLGIDDVEGLMDRLRIISAYKPPKDGD